jgi:hypothetical protein
MTDIIIGRILASTTARTGIIIHHHNYVKVAYNKRSGKINHDSKGTKLIIFFLYFGRYTNLMCNEIEYAMLEEYLAKIKPKESKEKEPEKKAIEIVA